MLLEASQISGGYPQGFRLKKIDLTLRQGTIVGLIGPNGSGKSTLLKILGEQLPHEGDLKWFGESKWSPKQLAKRIGFVSQFPSWEPGQRVSDVLRLGRSANWGWFGFESEQDMAMVEQAAKAVGVWEFKDRYMDELSGGQRQRVFIARSLANEPGVLLLDEPASSLDLRHQVELVQLLRELARKQNLGIMAACHDLNLATSLADELVVLDDGAVVASGKSADIVAGGLLERVYGVKLKNNGLAVDFGG